MFELANDGVAGSNLALASLQKVIITTSMWVWKNTGGNIYYMYSRNVCYKNVYTFHCWDDLQLARENILHNWLRSTELWREFINLLDQTFNNVRDPGSELKAKWLLYLCLNIPHSVKCVTDSAFDPRINLFFSCVSKNLVYCWCLSSSTFLI